MNKFVRATQSILNGSREIDNVTYSREGEDLYIDFSHSASNEGSEFVHTTWEKMVSILPTVADLTFEEDAETMLHRSPDGVREKVWVVYGE